MKEQATKLKCGRTGIMFNPKTVNIMKKNVSQIAAVAAIAIMVASGCATQPAASGRLKSFAIITSGDTLSYTWADTGPGVSVTEIDGKAVASPYGPFELAPGKHTVTMKCGDAVKANTVNVVAGEVYQFNKVVTPGIKGCVGSLLRVRSTNP